MLGGCSAIGIPFGEPAAGRIAPVRSNPVLTAKVTDSVDASDWEAVRRLVAGAAVERASDRLAWSNPDTGSTGTLATVAASTGKSGRLCRSFSTTVNDLRGIRRYRGEACQRTDGRWQLYGVTADDSVLS
jgi:surface antigen